MSESLPCLAGKERELRALELMAVWGQAAYVSNGGQGAQASGAGIILDGEETTGRPNIPHLQAISGPGSNILQLPS